MQVFILCCNYISNLDFEIVVWFLDLVTDAEKDLIPFANLFLTLHWNVPQNAGFYILVPLKMLISLFVKKKILLKKLNKLDTSLGTLFNADYKIQLKSKSITSGYFFIGLWKIPLKSYILPAFTGAVWPACPSKCWLTSFLQLFNAAFFQNFLFWW